MTARADRPIADPDRDHRKDGGPQCGGPSKRRDGRPCRNSPGMGTDHQGFGHCYLHFGNSETHVKQARRQQAEAAVAKYGLPRDIDPFDALMEEIHRAAGCVQYIETQIHALEPDALVWGMSKQEDINAGEGRPGVNTTFSAAVNVWLELYHRERKQLLDAIKVAFAVGIEERKIRLAEAQGRLAGEVLRKVLDGLNLSEAQQQLVPVLVRENMALLRVPAPSVN